MALPSPALLLALLQVQPAMAVDPVPDPAGETTAPVMDAQAHRLPPREVALRTLHKDNQTQMALANLALQRSEQPMVRRYARRLLRDHRFADRRTAALADRLDVSLEVLPEGGPELIHMQSMLVGLQDLEGEAFDEAFVQRVVQSHHQQILRLARLRNELEDGAVRQLVNAWLPILDIHLQIGRTLLVPRPIS